MQTKHKVFISYHHANDQDYKEHLADLGTLSGLFINRSVDTGGVSEGLDDQRIREVIRDDYLQDSTVTVVLVGTETARRKHVDWEIYSSMFDGKINKKSGILVVTLPEITSPYQYLIHAPHGQGEKALYPGVAWQHIASWDHFKQACPNMPDRIVDNLVEPEALVSVTRWSDIECKPEYLRYLIELAFRDRAKCKYNLDRRMRR